MEVVEQLDQEVDDAPHGPLAQYIRDDPETLRGLGGIRVQGGVMSLRRKGPRLYLEAQYDVSQTLSESQEAVLREFTRGQFSDGGGDGWLQGFWQKHPIRLEIQYQEITTTVVTRKRDV
jgi:hypothetical protein